jgi:hypothetical protein
MRRLAVLHPFLFAAFPVLFLFARNLHLFGPGALVGPLVMLIGLAVLLWMALTLVLKSGQKAGLIISLFLVLLFSFESLFEAVRKSVERVDWLTGLFIRLGVTPAGLRGFLLVVCLVVFVLVTYFLLRTRRGLHNLTLVANVVASALVVMTLLEIAAYEIRVGSSWRSRGEVHAADVSLMQPTAPEMLPDIYYIILDGYARADVLKEVYEYDNTEFIEYLSSKGFYVASESRSNYCQTFLSLASSLNMTHLDDLAARVGLEARARRPAVNMIWYSDVARLLKGLGYTTVTFSSGWWGTEVTQAEVYLSPGWHPDYFQSELIGMTPIPFLAGQFGVQNQHGVHRERILYTFEGLMGLSELEAPLFAFAHIIAPHPPFVFGRHGEEIGSEYRLTLRDGEHIIGEDGLTREEYVARYRDQVVFVNSKVQETVEAILSEPSRPAIIILQADHGPASMLDWESAENSNLCERFSILNAYYLPGGDGTQLYESITPVNTFRLIFNSYFGTDLELLADESYFSTYDCPYDLTNVTREIPGFAGIRDRE